MRNRLRTGPWKISELKTVIPNGAKVFSVFSCGGGSTMGYKLAGYELIGCCEIDPEMLSIYRANHHPRLPYLMGVQQFRKLDQLPQELFHLDLLDGSPPCSAFSMAGAREDKWGKATHFREGQAVQVLDDLFFEFIALAKRLQPKVVVAENVKGLILGNARGYVKQIFRAFDQAGYRAQLFLLNSSRMGVPQRRERTVFVASRKDLLLPSLSLDFQEPEISVATAFAGITERGRDMSHSQYFPFWQKAKPGESLSKYNPTGNGFNDFKLDPSRPANTITSQHHKTYHWETMRHLANREFCRLQSFPDDYDFKTAKAGYVCGMSVPPFMMQRIADQIWRQWLSGIPDSRQMDVKTS